ncbi:CDP-glycerol glycerophosphotransferase family protein [Anaerosacchariphilus polymeriproducens]|uniref:CDP-glycerol glycerophosphotransferase family protein n=1 Tax=Anaerosacchariphilus polymeriproducens TaxID=1812858 RepID=A0A371ARC5_9FIRM|nr:CDP-glycerol glycerophosphotransferase family protein [Anaerosacchariphilus polymeriproducens]RDU22092.1 CDP-glycerol glycerophosphotransferase family protein [Anaerosacchariphilus polymeriproducens]
MSYIKTQLYKVVNQNKQIRKFSKFMIRNWWKFRYQTACLSTKTDEKTFIFEAFQGRKYACSPKAIYEEMIRNKEYEGFSFLWIFREPENYLFLENNPNTKVIKFGSRDYYQAFAKAKYWVVNSRTRKCLLPKKNQVYIQTWHGTPLKRLGCDIMVEGNNIMSLKEMKEDYREEGRRVSYFLSPSSFYTEKISSAFDLRKDKKKIIELGYPRNDFLFKFQNDQVQNIREKLQIPKEKKVILYAPTFRDNQHTKDMGCKFQLGFDIERMYEMFNEDYVILFRTHYFVTSLFDFSQYKGFVYDVSEFDDINELYIISDLLITDYSSVFFDYANLKRPIIFFMYDFEEYKNSVRDFYLNIENLPGDIVKTEEELYHEIKRLENKFVYDERYQAFRETYNYLDGPDTSKKILKYILDKKRL